MCTRVGDFVEPSQHFAISGLHIELQSGRTQCRVQRHQEAALQVAVEALDLALRASPIWLTHPQLKAILVSHLEHAGMPAMQLRPVGIALEDHRLGVIEQHLTRYTPEVLEGRGQSIAPVLELLRVSEANEGRSAVAERGDECEQAIAPATDRREVRLHLQARLGLKPYDRIGTNRLEWADICLELADPAGVARRLDLAQQDRRRNPVWTRLLDALEQMGLEGIELAGPRFARPVLHLHRTTQVLAHRVTR